MPEMISSGIRNPWVIVFVASIGILSALGDATPIGPLLNEPLFKKVPVPNVDEVNLERFVFVH